MRILNKSFRFLRAKFFFSLIIKKKWPSFSLIEKFRELLYLKELLDELGITLVIDVGANEGQFGLDLKKIGYKGNLISFEPGQSAFQALKKNVSKYNKWSCYQYALGEEEKRAELFVSPNTKLSSFFKSDFVNENIGHTEVVKIMRLDNIIGSITSDPGKERILLKMDTQGYDLKVFSGARGILNNVKGLLSELSVRPLYKNTTSYKEALKIYEEEGFKLCNLSVVAKNEDKEIIELNCLMRKD
jgi:FkbM family methyltransferase